MTDNKFLNKTKIIELCDKPFDFVRVMLDTEVKFKTQFGYNTRVLLLIYFKDNKIVHTIKLNDSTFTLKTIPKYQYIQLDITKEQKKSDKGSYYPQSFTEPIDEKDIAVLKLKDMKRQITKPETVSQYADIKICE
ncbi:Hypothetical_protein [Hexamita inflata]|uniref:Hypothetical_protein n=1 Tax=Hexamita inflata TaxID=28002 RepID=A0AA86RHL9_9EUKA|nr:Hypothetical protein HINF_LOCUS65690 [Hexamita inflata]